MNMGRRRTEQGQHCCPQPKGKQRNCNQLQARAGGKRTQKAFCYRKNIVGQTGVPGCDDEQSCD